MPDFHHDTKPWSYSTIMEVPERVIGVYALWHRRSQKCIYVGRASAQPIKDRLHQHWSGSHNETLRLWIQVYGAYLDLCYAEVERNRIEALERRLIRMWNPEANVQHKR